jgi:hypothetical protein
MKGFRLATILSVLAGAACFGCRAPAADPPDAATSPQAQAEPAPLAMVPSAASAGSPSGAEGDAGPIEALRSGEALAPDSPREPSHEKEAREGGTRDAHESTGFALQAVLRTGEGPPGPRASEVNAAAIDAARRKTEGRLAVDLAAGRARFVFSGGFVIPASTELRARVDRYGHLLFWAGEDGYRIAPPGALRALLGERRLDVSPLSPAIVRSGGEGGHRLNVRTRRVDVTTRAAKATLEIASLGVPGEGGPLVCRFLLDLMSAAPGTSVCASDETPLHAEIHWTTRGGLSFDVTSIARRGDASLQALSTPPPAAPLVTSPPPPLPGELLLPRADIAAFRTAAVDVAPTAVRDAQAPEAGLLLVNSTDELRTVWIDGAQVAWVAPGGRLALGMLLRGRYTLQWRTFLGDGWEPPDTVVTPGVSEVGASGR